MGNHNVFQPGQLPPPAGGPASTAAHGLSLPAGAVSEGDVAVLTLMPGHHGRKVSEQLIGLSYETLQMHRLRFFSRSNHVLINLLRGLNPHGVLRLGGNTCDLAVWSEYGGKLPSFAQVPNAVFSRPHVITPEQLASLGEFLHAAGWRLIFGINLQSDLPEMAAQLAAAVQRAVGNALLAVQLGNEPDNFLHDSNRPYQYDEYFELWQRSRHAINQKKISVRLAGPGTLAHTDWVLRFAEQAPDIAALSRHYYRGNAGDPASTVQQLLAGDPSFFAEIGQIRLVADRLGVPLMLTEVNSYSDGGKLGISNTFAAALWGGDFALACAQAGVDGIHVHCGVLSVLEASLGHSMARLPSGTSLADRVDAISGRYAPIAGDVDIGFYPRPLYYGLLLAQQFSGGRLLGTTLASNGINLTAYAAQKNGCRLVALFNKDMQRDAQCQVRLDAPAARARLWRLEAPALDDVHHTRFAGQHISSNGHWTPQDQEILTLGDAGFQLSLPHGSAALVWLDG